MLKKQFNIRIQNLLFVILIPSFFTILLFVAVLVYSDTYDVLMEAFNNKILATSKITSSFTDGDRLKEMSQIKQFRGLAFNPKQNFLYANYFTDDRILVIDVSQNVSWHLPQRYGEYYLEDLAFSPERNHIYGVDIETNVLLEINSETGVAKTIGETGIDSSCFGLAYDTSRQILICNSDDALYRLDLNTGVAEKIFSVDLAGIRGLAYSVSEDLLYATITNTQTLYSIDLKRCIKDMAATCILQPLVRLKEGEKERLEYYGSDLLNEFLYEYKKNDYFVLGVFGLTYDGVNNKFYSSTTIPIVSYEQESGKVSDVEYDESIKDKEIKKKYYEHIISMFHVKEQIGITFLVSIILFDKGSTLYYVLDCDQNDTHAFVGYVDLDHSSSDSFEDVRDVWFKGNVFLSDIQYWDEWGLLKSAYVPIYNSNNEIVGITIADIDVSIIQSKIQATLFRLVLVGILLVTLAILISFYISNSQTRPIAQLKFGVLKVSVGNFGWKMNLTGAKEFMDVARDFNLLSNSLKEQIDRIKVINVNIESYRKEDALVKKLLLLAEEKENRYSLYNLRSQKHYGKNNQENSTSFVSGSVRLNKFSIYWKTVDYLSYFDAAKESSLLKVLLNIGYSRLQSYELQDIVDLVQSFGRNILDYFIIEQYMDDNLVSFKIFSMKTSLSILLFNGKVWNLKEFAVKKNLDLDLDPDAFLMISSPDLLQKIFDEENLNKLISLDSENKQIYFDQIFTSHLEEYPDTDLVIFNTRIEEKKENAYVSSKESL